MRHFKLIVMSILLGVLSVLFLKFTFDDMNYGLDLKGGFEVLYSVSGIEGEEVTEEMLTSTYQTLTKRIDVLGVSEPEIVIEGGNTIRVRLAGVTDVEQARNTLSSMATLSFRNVDDKLVMNNDVLNTPAAKLTYDNLGNPAVLLSVKDISKFYDATNEIKNMEKNLMVIWLDFENGVDSYNTELSCGVLTTSKCLSAATVNEAFASDVTITGNFTYDEALSLVELINSGSMPTKLTEIQSKTVSASLGEDSLNKTFVAGVIGIVLIMVFMIIAYRLAGFVASIGMIIYTAIVFFIFYNIGGVLTLPGIAAMVLGIGMAIDACVISFERIKEELYLKKDIPTSFKNGMKKSLSTILDANITTLVVAITLFIFGQSNVKGFATMLIISIITTLIVMVYINRILLKLFAQVVTNKTYFIGASKKKLQSSEAYVVKNNIDFIKIRPIFYVLSSVILLIGSVLIYMNGLNLSIDFSGGTNIIVNNSNASIEDVVNTLNEKYEIQKYNKISNDTYSFRINEVLDSTKDTTKIDEFNNLITEKYENAKVEISTDKKVIISNTNAEVEDVKTLLNNYVIDSQNIDSEGVYSFIIKGKFNEVELKETITKVYENATITSSDITTAFITNSNATLEELNIIFSENYTILNNKEMLENEYLFTIEEVLEDNNNEVTKLNNYIIENYENAGVEISVVTNIVQKELVKNAILSLLIASIVIVMYIKVRYNIAYAIGAIIALMHDILIVIVIFSVLNLEISSIFIAAILTIIGYSINDTIVTFDRIKELLNQNKKATLKDMINLGLSSTLTRTIITSVTTLIPVICLVLLGSYEILNFNIALLIGLISGAYSSFFIACCIFFEIEKRRKK